MRRVLLAILCCVAGPALADEAARPAALFDGKTLDGWEGNLKLFRVEDGAIVGGTLKERIARNEFLCTKKEYGDFELRLKVRLLGEGANAGIQFRTKRIPDHHEVSGYQADMGEGWWGKLYDESRRNRVLAEPGKDVKVKVNAGDWNDYVIRCEGPRIRLWLNGVATVDYTEKDDKIAPAGIIGLQIHGGPPSEAWYKDIALVELKSAKPKDEPVKLLKVFREEFLHITPGRGKFPTEFTMGEEGGAATSAPRTRCVSRTSFISPAMRCRRTCGKR